MVVAVGLTVTLVPVAVPTPGEMLRLVAPATSQLSVVLPPRKIVDDSAPNFVIVGGGTTVTVAVAVTLPAPFVAVRV
ncbi:hypothetical protein DAT35_55600 [Vitiosangium sp. GDMCC 1.1324]|nr:hypothetical protein DAT35_55600 [Vitiosangium sp. GDMCC 1.1324]